MENHLAILNRLLDVRKELKRLHDLFQESDLNHGLRRDHYLRLDTMVAAITESVEDAHIGTRRLSERQQKMNQFVVFDDDDTYCHIDDCKLILFDDDVYVGEGRERDGKYVSWKDLVRSKHGTVDSIPLNKIVDEWDNGGE